MLFLKLSNTDMLFVDKILIQRSYISNKTLYIIEQFQIIDKTDFIITILDMNNKIFAVYIAI